MSRRFELSGQGWDLIRPLLPPMTPQRGGRWRDHRQVLNGIVYRTRTGIPWRDLPERYGPWRDLPERYGPWRTVHDRLLRWEADGTWARIEQHLIDTDPATDLDAQIDSTVVRAHQHSAGGAEKGRTPEDSRAAQGLGKSRGGLTTKIHTICDGHGKPLVTALTPGQDADTCQLPVLVGLVRVNRPGPGRPRTRLDGLTGDKAYSSKANRRILRTLRTLRIRCTVPEREDQ